MLNLKHYQVVATDYDRYALVWRCQRTIFGHRRSVQIMSRQTLLEPQTLKELKTMLWQLEVDETVGLNDISHKNCDQPLLSDTSTTTNKPIQVKPNINNKNYVSLAENNSKPVETGDKINGKNKKKLISVDVGGFHLSISFPFW